MKIAIVSDIHDNIWKLEAALAGVQQADALLCCGDLCAPFIVRQLARGFPGPIHIVFGNNDGDAFRIGNNARLHPNVTLHGELFRGEFGGKRFAMNHYDGIARLLAATQEYDVVCYGHNHMYSVEQAGRTLSINPGPIMGAAFDAEARLVEVPSTYVIFDVETGHPQGYAVGASGKPAAI